MTIAATAVANAAVAQRRQEGLHLWAPTPQGGALLAEERRQRLPREAAEALARVAVRDGGLANWPMAIEDCGRLAADWDGQRPLLAVDRRPRRRLVRRGLPRRTRRSPGRRLPLRSP